MGIVFLDIDGVLNSTRYMVENPGAFDRRGGIFRMIDPAAVEILNSIVSVCNPSFIISSTWRKLHPLVDIREALRIRGFSGLVTGKTPIIGGLRGDEIASYLASATASGRANGQTRFSILDDDSDMGHLLPFHVKTDHSVGITMQDADRVIAMLKGTNGTN